MQYRIEAYENILDKNPLAVAFADNELEAEAAIRTLREKIEHE